MWLTLRAFDCVIIFEFPLSFPLAQYNFYWYIPNTNVFVKLFYLCNTIMLRVA